MKVVNRVVLSMESILVLSGSLNAMTKTMMHALQSQASSRALEAWRCASKSCLMAYDILHEGRFNSEALSLMDRALAIGMRESVWVEAHRDQLEQIQEAVGICFEAVSQINFCPSKEADLVARTLIRNADALLQLSFQIRIVNGLIGEEEAQDALQKFRLDLPQLPPR